MIKLLNILFKVIVFICICLPITGLSMLLSVVMWDIKYAEHIPTHVWEDFWEFK